MQPRRATGMIAAGASEDSSQTAGTRIHALAYTVREKPRHSGARTIVILELFHVSHGDVRPIKLHLRQVRVLAGNSYTLQIWYIAWKRLQKADHV